MAPDAMQGFLRLGLFIGVPSLLMIFIQPPGSAEFIVSVCSTAIGGAIIAGVVIVTRLARSG